ncbi:hypothetical protein NEIPOLOT_01330 [Neisseria polysaccharea ATCC 43768]|nr:hypothetical protein NEIPOLOT_01330 [Neisseria polysaccharea ATCC 43768]
MQFFMVNIQTNPHPPMLFDIRPHFFNKVGCGGSSTFAGWAALHEYIRYDNHKRNSLKLKGLILSRTGNSP